MGFVPRQRARVHGDPAESTHIDAFYLRACLWKRIVLWCGIMTQNDRLLTVEEVATQLRVSPVSVRRWIRAKALPAYKLDQSLRIKVSDVNAYLQSRWTGAGHAPGHLRDPLCALIDRALNDTLTNAEWRELFQLTGALWKSTDIVPINTLAAASELCGQDILQGSTYAQLVRELRSWVRDACGFALP